MIHALFENLPSFFMMALFGDQAIMLRNDAVLDNDHFQHSMEEGSDVEDVAEVTIVSTTINPVPTLSLTDCWRFLGGPALFLQPIVNGAYLCPFGVPKGFYGT